MRRAEHLFQIIQILRRSTRPVTGAALAAELEVSTRTLYRAEDGGRTERTVWPVVLGCSDTRRVLIAWCELRQGFRHFRTDRMQAAELLDQPIGEPRAPLLRRWEAWRSAELAATGRRPCPPTGHGHLPESP